MRRLILVLVILLVVGGGVAALVIAWGHQRANTVVVPLDQVPEPLMNKAKETLPEITFDHAHRLPNGNYEIRGKARNGKVREVEVNAAGEVVEIE